MNDTKKIRYAALFPALIEKDLFIERAVAALSVAETRQKADSLI